MTINHIQISKSRTIGGSSFDQRKIKFNKIIVTLDADLSEGDDSITCYRNLSQEVDLALDYESQKNESKKETIKI